MLMLVASKRVFGRDNYSRPFYEIMGACFHQKQVLKQHLLL